MSWLHDKLRLFYRLVREQNGSASVASTILVTSIISLGAMVGLVTVRDQVLQQFGDVAVGLDTLDQSYKYSIGIDVNGDGDFQGPEDCILEGVFEDTAIWTDPAGQAPACLDLTIAPSDES